jgi:hypothetical protein
LLMVNRQRERLDSLLRHPLVWDPLLESPIHGFLLVADHPYRDALDARAEPARPAAVRDAMEIIDTCSQMPPRPVRRRAQGDVRRNTAASPALCALNSANPKARSGCAQHGSWEARRWALSAGAW